MIWLYIGLGWAAINILAVWCGVGWHRLRPPLIPHRLYDKVSGTDLHGGVKRESVV